jgi:CheY-like chemotaxis protein
VTLEYLKGTEVKPLMKKRILIVDDEPDFTNLLKLSLEAMGY